MEKKKIDRINELARLKKERELSQEEKEEQQALRKEFLSEIRADLKQTLDNIEIVDDAAPASEKNVPESDLVDHIIGETISIKEYNAE